METTAGTWKHPARLDLTFELLRNGEVFGASTDGTWPPTLNDTEQWRVMSSK